MVVSWSFCHGICISTGPGKNGCQHVVYEKRAQTSIFREQMNLCNEITLAVVLIQN